METLTAAELEAAGPGGKRLRRERVRRWRLYCCSKPPGHLAINEAAFPWYWHRRRGVTCAELDAAGPGGRWIRQERRRRARALLLGALVLRKALLQSFANCASSLWLYGVP